MDYDEDAVLTRYVWDYYWRLMTSFEREVGAAILGRMKTASMGLPSDSPHPLNARWGRTDDPGINAALAAGAEAYRRNVRDRVLAEHAAEVFINRCPSCNRVVNTPKARQCFWCGHDWHDQSRE